MIQLGDGRENQLFALLRICGAIVLETKHLHLKSNKMHIYGNCYIMRLQLEISFAKLLSKN